MKVFFSYGHEHQDFVRVLAAEIKKQSNGEIEPWFDEWDIKEQDNWRSKITEGILESKGVVAFLSEKGCREDGVCLDELRIALVSKYGMIKSILLDKTRPRGTFMPPSTVSEYQWADMSDYKDAENLDEYIKTKAAKIVEMLSGDDIQKYNSNIEELRKRLGLPEIPTELPKFERLINTSIIGRKWLSTKITEWLNDPEGEQIMMLYGKPGAGKSMYAAHLQHYNYDVAAAIACDYQSNEFSDTDNVINWLAYRLALRMDDYRSWLINLFSDEKLNLGTGLDRFSMLITQPLSKLINGDRTRLMVVIDGLDEMKNDNFATFLSENIENITPKLRFLITSRKEEEIDNQFEEFASIDLNDYDAENNTDLNEYFAYRLASLSACAGFNEFINRLVEASEGVFTYAECVCNNILSDYKKNPAMELANYPLPKGILQLFKNTMDRREFSYTDANFGKLDYQGFWQIPLGMVLFAPSAISKETLKKLMNWDNNAYNAFRLPLGTFIEEENGKLRGFHKSFGEWLDKKGGKYATSREDAIVNLAKKCYGVYKTGVDNLDEYMLLNITKLLREAGLKAEYMDVAGNEEFDERVREIWKKNNATSKFTAAVELCEEMVQVSEDIVAVNPGEDNSKKLGNWYWGLGDSLYNRGELSKALGYLEKCLEIDEALVSQNPENQGYKNGLGVLLDRIGDILERRGEVEKALEYYTRELEIFEALVSQNPENQEYKNGLGVSLNKIGYILESRGKVEKALEYYKRSLEIGEELVSQNPENQGYKNCLGISLNRIRYILESRGKVEKALEYYKRSLEIREKALEYYTRDLEIFEALVSQNPENQGYKNGLGVSLERIGYILESRGEVEKAQEYYKRSLEIREALVSQNPENQGYKNGLGVSLERIGDRLRIRGEVEKAQEYYKRSFEIREALVSQNPENQDYKNGLGVPLERIGDILRSRGEVEKALEYYKRSLEIGEELVSQNPENQEYKYDLGVPLERIGDVLRSRGEVEKAIEYYKRELEIFEALVSQNPENQEYKNGLRISLRRIGELLENQEEINEEYTNDLYDYYKTKLELLHNMIISDYSSNQMDLLKNHYAQCLAISEKLNELQLISCETKSFKAHNMYILGFFSGYLHENQKAMNCFQLAIELFEEILIEMPNKRIDLADTYYKYATFLNEIGEAVKALDNCEKSIALYDVLLKEKADDELLVEMSYEVLNCISNITNYLHNIEKAKVYFVKTLNVLDKLSVIKNDADSYLTQKADILNKLAAIANDEDNTQEALTYYEQIIEIREQILAKSPEDEDETMDLYHAVSKLADLYKEQGMEDKAKQYFDKAIKILGY